MSVRFERRLDAGLFLARQRWRLFLDGFDDVAAGGQVPEFCRNVRRRPRALTVTNTDAALADLLEAITVLTERNPTAAAKLDTEIARCIQRLADRDFDGPVSRLRSGAVVRSWECRRSGFITSDMMTNR